MMTATEWQPGISDARLQVFSFETLDRKSSSQIPLRKFHPRVTGFHYIKHIIQRVPFFHVYY